MLRRDNRRRLGVEQLESRCVLSSVTALPSTAGLGINIDSLTDYSPDLLFANAMMTARHWGSPATPWDEAAPLDAQGWPTQDAGVVVTDPTGGDVGGTYALSFTGQAANIAGVDSGNVQVIGQQYDAATNTTTAQVLVPAGEPQLILSFTGTQRLPTDSLTANPNGTGIANVVLMRPEVTDGSIPYPAGTLFTANIENLISSFQVIRFMDYSMTNNNPQVNWSDRTLPSAATQQSVAGGAWEYAVELANATDKDMWINIPEGATPEYVDDLADLIAYGSDGVNPYTSPQADPVYPPLNSNLKVYFEYSNELWNYNFTQATANQDAALAEAASGTSPINYDGTTNTFILTMRRVIEQTVNDSEVFRSVFGDAAMMTRIRPVFTFQYDNQSDTAQMGLDFLNDYYDNADGQMNVPIPEPPDYYLWGAGGAWYATVNDDSGNGDVTVGDGGFESPAVTDYQVAPAGSSWNFSGSAGIAADGSSLGNPAAPEGTQAAFLQASGSFSQSVTFSGGYADISFSAAQLTAASESFAVLYDGTPIGLNASSDLFTPGGNTYQSLVTVPFETTPGAHTLTFVDMGGGGTALVDDVQVQTVNAMYNSGVQNIAGIVATESAWATAYGLQMVSYEGGFHIGGDTPTALQVIANLDPRAQTAETDAIDAFFLNGGNLALLYDTTHVSYELTGDLDNLNTPKLLAIYSALAAGLPAPAIGTALPATIGQSVTLPEAAPGYREGNETNAAMYLVETTAPGTFTVTFQGSQGSPDTTEELMVDGRIVPVFISLPGSQGTSSPTVTVSFALPGLHAISLLSDNTYDLNLSGNVTITAVAPPQAMAATTSLAASTAPTVVGQPVTLTATVTPVVPTDQIPSGEVTFMDGTNVLGTGAINLAGGLAQAALTTDSLAIGSHSITAVYTGDPNFAASMSTDLAQAVDSASTTTSLAPSSSPVDYGQSVTLAASVGVSSPGAGLPTGTVSFYAGNTLLGTAPVVLDGQLGQATLTTTNLPGGADSLTAVYNGNANFLASTSAPVPQSVNQAASSIALASDLSPAGFGQALALTAVVSSASTDPALPGGLVTFYDAGNPVGTAPLSVVGGVDEAMLSISSLPVGYDSLTAGYSGDGNFLGSTSAAILQAVGPANTAVNLINFEDLAVTGTPLAEPLVEDGYAFNSSGTSAGDALLIENSGSTVAPGGWPSNVLMAAYWGTSVNLSAAGGGPFNLLGLDVDVNYQAWSAVLTAYDAGGNVLDQTAVNFTLGNSSYATATLDLGWLNVSSVSISWWQYLDGGGAARFGAIDNLRLSSGPVLPALSVSDAGGTYSGTAFPAGDTVAGVGIQATPAASLEGIAPGLTYYVGANASGSPCSAAPSTAGTYTVVASFAGSTDYVSAAASTTFTIDQAQPTVSVADAGGVFSGGPFAASATVDSQASLQGVSPTLWYFSGTAASGTALAAAPSTAGTYTVLASFAGSTDYTSGQASATFSITQATPVVSLTDSGGIYSGSFFPAVVAVNNQASLEGVSPTLGYYSGTSATGTLLTAIPSNAGTYSVLASFAGSTDFTSAQTSVTFTIAQAMPLVSVSDDGGIYMGSPYPAAATVNSQASVEGVTPLLFYFAGTTAAGTALAAAPSAAGTYTVLASFAGSPDYTGAAASATFTVAPAIPLLGVVDAGGIYSGSAYPATATVNGGASLEQLVPTLTYYCGANATGTALGGAPSTAGTYTALAIFAGSSDYTSAAASTAFTIGQAVPEVAVTVNSRVYNAAPLAAGDTVAGVNGVPGGSLEGVPPTLSYFSGPAATGSALAGAPSTAGTYTVLAIFAGSTDYISGAASAAFSITPAVPSLTVTDFSGPFTGLPFSAAGMVSGVNGVAGASLEGVTPTFAYYSGTVASGAALASAPSTVGTYAVLASFAGSQDYVAASASTTFSITKAAPPIALVDKSGPYTGSPFAAATLSLEGVTPALAYYAGTSATGSGLSGAPSELGTYVVVAKFAGSQDYTSGVTSVSFSITKAAPILSVTDAGGTYSGSSFPAGDTVAGVNHVAGSNLEGVKPTLSYYSGTAATGKALPGAPSTAGSYLAVESFAGSTHYTSASASVPFTISRAAPTVTVTAAGGTYNGKTLSAKATVAGVNHAAAANLEGVAPTLSYFAGTVATGSPLGAAPSNAGTYLVLANFAGSADYSPDAASTTFTIAPAGTKTTLTASTTKPTSGNAVTFTATLAVVSPGAGTPTGTVQFIDGSTALAPPVSVTVVKGQVIAQLTISTLGVGTHSITAVYLGDGDFLGSTSSAISVTVGKATVAVTTASSANPATNSQALTFTVTIKPPASGAPAPTGSIVVTDTYDGVKTTLTPISYDVEGSDLVVTVALAKPLSTGRHTITVAYSGDGNYAAATASMVQTVQA